MCLDCISPYLPREGPETIRQFEFLVRHTRIATYLPREGPETVGHIHNVQHMKFGQV